MIRASNIRVESHLADFRCDDCGDVQEDINVNTDENVTYNVWGEQNTGIRVKCWNEECDKVSIYPLEGGGHISQQLAQAKTA